MNDPFFVDPNLDQMYNFILSNLINLSPAQQQALHAALTEMLPAAKPPAPQNKFDETFSLSAEVEAMLNMSRALRQEIMSGDRLREGVDPRAAKEAISANNTLLNTLLKVTEQVRSFERQRSIEKAVVDSLKSLPAEYQEEFLANLTKVFEEYYV